MKAFEFNNIVEIWFQPANRSYEWWSEAAEYQSRYEITSCSDMYSTVWTSDSWLLSGQI
jgi:hypothetical protein